MVSLEQSFTEDNESGKGVRPIRAAGIRFASHKD